MIHTVKKKHTKKQVLKSMRPLIQTWFDNSFEDVTQPQAYAIPIIHDRKNVLISSPTGSGKTLTAFLSIINELMVKQKNDELKDEIYCVYVSPLKALANDIDKNLKQPLAELTELAEENGEDAPKIRVGVRTGDTPASERQKMAKKPPHILITTPESLAIILTTPKFSEKLKSVEWLIMDEIHDICNSKRGSMLSVTFERLESRLEKKATRIGLSATQSPIETIANFLGGYDDGEERDVWLVQAEGGKDFDIKVITPVEDITSLPFEIVNARMYEKLKELIDDTRTTLVFTNTRSGTEQVMLRLGELGLEDIAAHHGSLSRETRLDVEDRLKRGELKAAISSTSLELGIDIGTIDLVCQIGSPKSIAKGLQRVGRAGHGVGEESKGRFMVFDNDDLVECAVLAKSAIDHEIDRVFIPSNPLDVLAQTVVGLSIERKWDIEDAYGLIRNSYSFHDLSWEDYISVLRYLGSRDMPNVYSKIWLDEDEGIFGSKRGSRLIYYLNSGTIPEEANFKVFLDKGGRLGELSEGFVEKLGPGDVFVLGGKSYVFERAMGMSLFVKDATGRRPSVPSWTGEMLPRSFDLSVSIGDFRGRVKDRLMALGDGDRGDGEDDDGKEIDEKKKSKILKETQSWLIKDYNLDPPGARSIISYFREQAAFNFNVPSDKNLLIEGYIDQNNNRNLIFHFCFGRRVNDALSRAYAMVLSDMYDVNVSVSITDDNFMLTTARDIPLSGFEDLIKEDELEELLERAIGETELFKHRFRHCSTRSFMVLRNYKGRQVPVGRQQQRSKKVLRAIRADKDFPIVKETYKEVLTEVMDLANARDIILSISNGERKIHYSDYRDIPSPFAHNVVLSGMSDIVLMHDRSALLKEMHRKVLERIGGAGSIKPELEQEVVDAHFSDKIVNIQKKEDIIPLMLSLGPVEVFQRRGKSLFDFSDADPVELTQWCAELVNDGAAHSAWVGKSLWTPTERTADLAALYMSEGEENPDNEMVLDILADAAEPLSVKVISNRLSDRTEKEWDTVATRKVLTYLERQYRIGKVAVDKKKYGLWGLLNIKASKNRDRLLEERVTDHLDLFGPFSLEEISFELKLPEEEIQMALGRMEADGTVMARAFTEPYVQYMLAQDYSDLTSEENNITLTRAAMDNYHLMKHFEGFKSLDDLFETFGSVGMLNDVAARIGLDGLKGWSQRRKDGEILQGRFWDGSVCYVLKKDVPKFINAYRNEDLGKVDLQILNIISKNPGIDITKLQELTELPKDILKARVEKLDRNIHIARKPVERSGQDSDYEGFMSRNLYHKLTNRPSKKDGKEWLVEKVISAYGPVSMYDIARSVGMTRAEMKDHIKELMSSGKLAEVAIVGSERQKLYVWEKELKALRNVGSQGPHQPGDEKIRILTILDPFTFHHRNEIRMKFGDAWYYTIFKGSRLIGMMEMWEMSGCLEIRELRLDTEEDLSDVLKALDEFSEIFKKNYHDVIRFTGALGTSVEDLDKAIIKVFKKAGYFRQRNWLLKGNVIDLTMTEDEIISYVLWRQHVIPERHFLDMESGLSELGGFKSDHEVGIRVSNPRGLKRLLKERVVEWGKMIPDYLAYTLPEDTALYKAAKHVEIDREMRYLITILDSEHEMKRNRLLEAAPLGYNKAVEALNRLIKGLHIIRAGNNMFYLSPEYIYEKEEAREKVLWLIISSFGIFSAEWLSMYTKGEFRMGEIRRALGKFESEGKLVKGFVSEDDNILYWMMLEDIGMLPMKPHDLDIVLAPSAYDRLSTYLLPIIRKRFGFGSSFIVISEGIIIAAFRGNMRKTELLVGEYRGDEKGWDLIPDFSRRIGRRMKKKEDPEAMTDDEIMDWYDKTSGKEFE